MIIRYLALFPALLMLLSSCSSIRFWSTSEIPDEKVSAVASWYGEDFHGRPTSSGEIFNMYAYTCAHKSYPFGTRLKVTNLSNRKVVECIVNDRGPFVDGRDLDLSYASAKEIGVIGPGTAKVMMEVSGRDDSYIRKVKVQAADRRGPFTIQVGAFTESENALRLKAALSTKYVGVYIQEAEVKENRYYRVRVGNFRSLSNALSIAEQLGQEGYSAVVTKADVKS